jgi:hypothetical protein
MLSLVHGKRITHAIKSIQIFVLRSYHLRTFQVVDQGLSVNDWL